MNIGEIFIKLGFHADTFTLKDFSKALGELPMKAVTSMLGIAGVSLEIGTLVNKAMDAAAGFHLFTAVTSLSSKELQRWQLVAKQVGMTGQEVTGSFVGVDNAIKRMKTGVGGRDLGNAFALLGIDWRTMNADQVMESIRKSIPKMNKRQMDMLETRAFPALGIDIGMIKSLGMMAPGEFTQRGSAVDVMNQGQIEAALKLKTAFVTLEETIEHAITGPMKDFTDVIIRLTPYLKEWIPKSYEWAKKFDKPANNPGAKARAWIDKNIDSFTDLLVPLPYNLSVDHARMTGDLNLTQYIQSTANAEEVARLSVAEIRQKISATKYFGNSEGRSGRN